MPAQAWSKQARPEGGRGPPQRDSRSTERRRDDDDLSFAVYSLWSVVQSSSGVHLKFTDQWSKDIGPPLETIAAKFRLIEDFQVPLVVPWRDESGDDDTAERLLHDLAYAPRPGPIARRLQPYVVQVPPYRRSALLTTGAVSVIREEEFGQQFVVLENLDLYRADTGLSLADPTYRRTEGLVL